MMDNLQNITGGGGWKGVNAGAPRPQEGESWNGTEGRKWGGGIPLRTKKKDMVSYY